MKALAALGKKAEAIRYAESCRGPWTPDGDVDALRGPRRQARA